MYRSISTVLVCLAALVGTARLAAAEGVPMVYSSDLCHPHGDPDDHFDLATLFCLPELDVRGIVLDNAQGPRNQQTAPGRIPVEQMLKLTGRQVPYAIGLASVLTAPDDRGLSQPAAEQAGVDLLLQVLRKSPQKVVLMTTGSLRDVAAAWSREPELLRTKVERLYMSIGDPSVAEEYEHNVLLDPQAYVCILQSGLPISWYPCFDRGPGQRGSYSTYQGYRGRYSTYWKFTHRDVLETAPEGLQNWFIFALLKMQGVDPIAFLSAPQHAEQRAKVWAMPRNMWTTIALLNASGREIYERPDGHFVPLTSEQAAREGLSEHKTEVLRFDPVAVQVVSNADGKLKLKVDFQPAQTNLQVSHILHPRYEEIMTDCLRELLRGFGQ